MRYAFLGTPEFAAIILDGLIAAGMPPTIVVTNPDRPVGRKRIVPPPPAKTMAEKYGIRVWQPEKLSAEDWKNNVGEIDFGVVAAYAKILPPEILSIPERGFIVVHPSLLPRHRGATPIQTAILSGDAVTGATLILADEKVDHGPVIAKSELQIANRNYKELERVLAELSADLLIKTIPEWLDGKVKPQAQNEVYATYTKKFTTEDGFVDSADLNDAQNGTSPEKALTIQRMARALNPEPGTWTIITPELISIIRTPARHSFSGGGNKRIIGKRMKILDAEIKNDALKLKTIQVEGETPKNL